MLVQAAPAAAQWAAVADAARIRAENKESVWMLIGADEGRAYIRAQNISGECVVVRSLIRSYPADGAGDTDKVSKTTELMPFEVGDTLYLDGVTPGQPWLDDWSVDPSPAAATEQCRQAPLPPDRDAVPFYREPPTYPDVCMDDAADVENVVVRFVVDTRGRPKSVRVLDATNSCLNGAALSAVRRWVYTPMLESGRPVLRTYVETMFTFVLED